MRLHVYFHEMHMYISYLASHKKNTASLFCLWQSVKSTMGCTAGLVTNDSAVQLHYFKRRIAGYIAWAM